MKRIIALYGHQGCGKSETLNYVRELIRANGGVSLSANPPYKGDQPETFNYKGQIVCVCPGGDTARVVNGNFQYAYSKNADVILTASRTRGGSAGVVHAEATKLGIRVKWFPKSYEYCLSETTQSNCNREYAMLIFSRL